MELNQEELAIINRAFEKMPFPDDQETIDLLREKIKTGVASLFDANGESADNLILNKEASDYADKIPSEPELFDKDGNPVQTATRESAHEVYKVCSAFENYRKDFFATPKKEKTDKEIEATLADFRNAWQYLTPENKKKMEALADVIGYSLPDNTSKRIADRRRHDFSTLQEMGKTLKKDKNNIALKNKLTTLSRNYVAGYFRDVEKLTKPQDIADLGNMALKANSLIQTNVYNRPYVRTVEYYQTKSKILTHVKNAYQAMGDFKKVNQANLDIAKFNMAAERAQDYGYRQNFENSPDSYNFR